jgi:putative membrane protein
MARFLIKLILNAVALWVTTLLVVGVRVEPTRPTPLPFWAATC